MPIRTGRRIRVRRRKKKQSIDKKQTKDINMLKNLMLKNIQEGWSDDTFVADITNAGAVYYNWHSLDSIAQGDAPYQRTGNKITLNQIHIKGHVTAGAWQAANNGIFNLRIIIFKVLDEGDVLFTVNQLLETIQYNSFYKKDSSRKFKILKDKKIILSRSAATNIQSRYAVYKNFNFKLKFGKKGLPIWYRGSIAGNPTKANIQMLLISDSSVGLPSSDQPKINMLTRIHYSR